MKKTCNKFPAVFYYSVRNYIEISLIFMVISVRANKWLGKQRVPFDISDVLVQGKSILLDSNHLETNIPAVIWDSSDHNVTSQTGEILIQLLSPIRFKVEGAYTLDFEATDFMLCLLRRMKTICSLYGESDLASDKYDFENCKFKITQRALQWKDNEHYSSRQHTAMELGGITGTFTLAGTFSQC